MEIKEVEALLSVSRSNIRFYEKAGLLDPKRGKNNYRNYSEADVAMLRKIIVLRKLGFSVEEISAMQKNELPLSEAVREDIARLEAEIERLKGALATAKALSADETTFEEMNEARYWDMIRQGETAGEEYVDICKDYTTFLLYNFDNMWKYVFFHDFKASRKKQGVVIACGILLLICIVRGIAKVVLWHESFWSGFFYPMVIFLIGSVILLPVFLLAKKAPRATAVICNILLFICIGFLVLVGGLLLYGLIMLFIHR